MNAPGMHQRNAEAEKAGVATCRVCQTAFAPKKPWQRFCSTACRRAFHKAQDPARLDDLERRVAELERLVKGLAGHAPTPVRGDVAR